MKKYTSKIPARMKQYTVMMELARDSGSTLYNSDGSQNRAASNRAAFWNGYTYGTEYAVLTPSSHSISYPSFRAGIDFKTTQTGL